MADSRGPWFGRQPELRQLEGAYDAAFTSGGARIVTIVGAQGVGKSRLIQEFLHRARERTGRAAPRAFRSVARPSGSSYDIVTRLLRTRFDLPYGLPDDEVREKLRKQVAAVLGDKKVNDVCYFLGQLLDVSFEGSPLIDAVSDDPVQLKILRRGALKLLIETESQGHTRNGLVIYIIEDLHHAHDDSMELVEYLTAHLEAPVLLIITARPELLAKRATFGAHFGAHSGASQRADDRHTLIELGPFSEMDAERMMETLLAPVSAGGGEIPQELVAAACSAAGGNPALLERMVRHYFDSGVLTVEEIPTDDPFLTEERWHVNLARLATAKLPMTQQDAVAARIGALDPIERSLLESAAAMGSVFWLGSVVALARIGKRPPALWQLGEDAGAFTDEETIAGRLEKLVRRDYILKMPDSTFAEDEEYVFKHNLEREALEKLIPAAELSTVHRTIADWLEFRPNVEAHEEHIANLAVHRERSGTKARAALTWIEAGNLARSRYGNAKAAEYYQRGLLLLADRHARSRLEALHHYGDVLLLLGHDDEALAQFEEMRSLAWSLDLPAKGGAAHNRIGRLFRETGRLDEAAKHLITGLKLFSAAGDERGVASSQDDIGKLAWLRGDYPQALDYMKHALAARKRLADRRSIALSLNNLGLVLQDSGHYKEALDVFEQSHRIRREIGDLLGVIITLNNLGTIAQDQHDDSRAMELFLEALAVAREVGDRHKIVLVLTNIGETYYRTGDTEKAVATLKESEFLAEEIGDRLLLAEAVRGLGKAFLLRGDLTKARDYTVRALGLFEQVRSKVQTGVALRTLAEVTAAGGWGEDHVGKAREYFVRSIGLFEEIGNEVELARTFRVYADFLMKHAGVIGDPNLEAEAKGYVKRADDVFAKLKISAIGIDPSAFFS